MTVELDPVVREGIRRIADALFPGTAEVPSASAVGTHRELLDLAVRANPRLAASTVALGERAAALGEITVEMIECWPADLVQDMFLLLSAAYYMSRTVRDAIGYPGQGRNPIAEAPDDHWATDDLLAPVIARGPVYVEIPG